MSASKASKPASMSFIVMARALGVGTPETAKKSEYDNPAASARVQQAWVRVRGRVSKLKYVVL